MQMATQQGKEGVLRCNSRQEEEQGREPASHITKGLHRGQVRGS